MHVVNIDKTMYYSYCIHFSWGQNILQFTHFPSPCGLDGKSFLTGAALDNRKLSFFLSP